MRQDAGDSVNVAALTLSVHTGTHADGGYHVSASGSRAGELPLSAFLGPARVIDARRRALDEDIVSGIDLSGAERVLFRTRDAVDESNFPESFQAPTVGLARKLVAAGVRLIGSDAPSMDEFHSKTLEAHHILVDGGVAILENLVLTNVPEGEYTLIALPLKLVEADSSPVRAVLIEGDLA
jgi:arylformamidase